MNTTLKRLKVVFGIVLILCIALTLVACGGKKTPGGGGGGGGGGGTTDVTRSDIKVLNSLTYYGDKSTDYNKPATDFNYSGKTFAGADCTSQIEKLQERISQKDADVLAYESTSAFVKIFAKSTPEGILSSMAKAGLTFAEMNRVVAYLSGSVENPSITSYIFKTSNGWTGSLTTTEYLKLKNGTAYLNAGWSFFDDYDLYDKLQDYASDKSLTTDTEKDRAADNASWVYRSILQKVYEEVALEGASFARLATYLLDYAIDIVESADMAGASITGALQNSKPTGEFAVYCMTKATNVDPYSGLGDYDCLSYLLSFNDFFGKKGLATTVGLYGYYYDYNKAYYNVALKDEETYKNQLAYEKLDVFTTTQWLDYVNIQRNIYEGSYRYSEDFYDHFYQYHLEFQDYRDENDVIVYSFGETLQKYNLTSSLTSYTKQMSRATTASGSYDGVNGQLAFGDWLWCYSGSNDRMKAYNDANTVYQNGKDSGNSEREYEGQFKFEMEQLKIADYLLTNMSSAELANALYFECYSYSASVVSQLDSFLKQIRYIDDEIEEGTYYTNVADEIQSQDIDTYCSEKLAVYYYQAYTEWKAETVDSKASNANQQSWSTMQTELKSGMEYDYDGATYEGVTDDTIWKHKCDRLEDNIIQKKWSCCGQNCVTAEVAKCPTGHIENSDGTQATKDYDSSWKISLFADNYETILRHTAGNVMVSFYLANSGYAYTSTSASDLKSYHTGYYMNGTSIADLNGLTGTTLLKYADKTEEEITLSSGEVFIDKIEGSDLTWWNGNKNSLTKADDNVWTEAKTEMINSTSTAVKYTYTFAGWYLDKDCRFLFNENDDVPINLKLYAGYNVVKAKNN